MSERNLKAVITHLLTINHLLSTGDILSRLATAGKTYNKTSVYRALEQLVATGQVCRHYFNDGEAQYELRVDHHVHLVCTVCGQVTAGECTYEQPATVGSFQVDHHHLTLMGICASCQ